MMYRSTKLVDEFWLSMIPQIK